MNDQLSNKIMEKIDAENLTPLPYWRFVALRSLFWLLSILSVVIGSIAVGTIIFLCLDDSHHGLPTIPDNISDFLLAVPYLWIMVLALFIFVAKASIQHTKQGYRYRLRTIVVVSFVSSILLGTVLCYVGIGQITHETLNEVSFYNFVIYDSRDAWSRPTIGRLSGAVLSIQNNRVFSITDLNGKVWMVHLATSSDGLFIPEASSTVRMFGLIEPLSGVFIAQSVDEWEQ